MGTTTALSRGGLVFFLPLWCHLSDNANVTSASHTYFVYAHENNILQPNMIDQ